MRLCGYAVVRFYGQAVRWLCGYAVLRSGGYAVIVRVMVKVKVAIAGIADIEMIEYS